MQTKWPLVPTLQRNPEDSESKNTFTVMENCYLDDNGSIKKRPGLITFSTLHNNLFGVDGLYWWDEQAKLIAVSKGRIYDIAEDGTATDVTGAVLRNTAKVSFASVGDRLFMCNGGRLVIYDGSGTTAYASGSGSPTSATSVIYYDGYLLCSINDAQRVDYGELNLDTNQYDFAGNFFSAESKPDNLLGLRAGWREIVAVGEDSIEWFYNDGVTPFSRVGNMLLDSGCAAFNSFRLAGGQWYWLDENRNIVRLQDRVPIPVSQGIARDLWELKTINDCYATEFKWNGQNLLSFNFPSDGKSFVFDLKYQTWYIWTSYDQVAQEKISYRGLEHVYARAWNKVMVSARTRGFVYQLDPDVYQDSSYTSPIIMKLRTAYLDHDTHLRKTSRKLYLRVTRGEGTADMQFTVRFRDDGLRRWSKEYTLGQGSIGDFDQYLFLPSLGEYRARQWELTHSALGPITILGVEEDVEVVPE